MGQPFHFRHPRKRLALPALTGKQRQYVESLIDGLTPVEIAAGDGCTARNVHAVLRSARERTGYKTREALAVWWAFERQKQVAA